jgi:hypothetical protein
LLVLTPIIKEEFRSKALLSPPSFLDKNHNEKIFPSDFAYYNTSCFLESSSAPSFDEKLHIASFDEILHIVKVLPTHYNKKGVIFTVSTLNFRKIYPNFDQNLHIGKKW